MREKSGRTFLAGRFALSGMEGEEMRILIFTGKPRARRGGVNPDEGLSKGTGEIIPDYPLSCDHDEHGALYSLGERLEAIRAGGQHFDSASLFRQ